jgi:hypothetical protein
MEYWNTEIFNYPCVFEPLYLVFSYFCIIINYFVFLSCIGTLFTIKQRIPAITLRKYIPLSSMLLCVFHLNVCRLVQIKNMVQRCYV